MDIDKWITKITDEYFGVLEVFVDNLIVYVEFLWEMMFMQKQYSKLVIESIKEDGKRFRPSDWIERISATLGTFGPDHRLHYAESVKPAIVNGEKCLVVDQNALEEKDPATFDYIMQFAKSNQLRFYKEAS